MSFPMDAKVRFTEERLSVLTPRDRKGLAGRIGVVQTDGARVNKPTVYFPVDGLKPDIRLFRLDPRHLELVEGPPETPAAPASAWLPRRQRSSITPRRSRRHRRSPRAAAIYRRKTWITFSISPAAYPR